jgi:hypothetical protein
MIQPRIIQQPKTATHCPALKIIAPINHASNAPLNDRPSTHSARLNRHKKRSVREPVVPDNLRRRSQSHNLRMRSGIAIPNSPVTSPRNDAIPNNNHRSHWHFAGNRSLVRLRQRRLHPPNIVPRIVCHNVGAGVYLPPVLALGARASLSRTLCQAP